ncbi:Ig-like domain-containing protein [Streptomyces huiliensis]|uniref:Ig-like domain-containing protein n=1 Tax=Streptomyces huiliensis TaxID=2876027 RepID=UPI001CBC9258|nr:Ig-like domain-containing protein [Streptomyces huiliensis]MBZ4319868.1 Ig-like domain-containing protein [Streptomyces huiliensis]
MAAPTSQWKGSMKLVSFGPSFTALALAVTATVGLAAGNAAAVDRHHHPERLNATAYYGTLDIVGRQTNNLKAKFTKVDGTAVAGLPVKFTVSWDRFFLCEATTDTNGYAECKNSPLPAPLPLTQLVLHGYDATFDGNHQYAPASAHNSVGVP